MTRLFNQISVKPKRSSLRAKQTDCEKVLWFHLRNRRLSGHRFLRQYSIGQYIIDFYCPKQKLAIELDGSQHLERIEYDQCRSNYLQSLGLKVIRYNDTEVLRQLNSVLENISSYLTPPDLPFGKGEGNPTLLSKRGSGGLRMWSGLTS